MTDSDQTPVTMTVRRRRRRRTQHRWLHTHKKLAIGGIAAASALLLVSGWLGYLNEQVDDVHRFDLALASKDSKERPARVKGEALNILMVGLDSDNGTTLGDKLYELIGTEEWEEHDFSSDMLAVLHVSADRKRAQLVSVPGNSLVEVPGYPGERRIKESFRLGGPDLTAETVEETFDVHIDHLMMLDFEAFKEVTEVLGGVDVFVAETTRDDFNNRTWQAGVHRVEGQDALDYVRQIDGLPNGDFDRIRRQQAFLRAIWDKLASNRTLANPVKVTKLANQLHELIAVDEEFTNKRFRELALSSRKLRTSEIRFVTVPNKTEERNPNSQFVRLEEEESREMFDAIEEDRFAQWQAENDTSELSSGEPVR